MSSPLIHDLRPTPVSKPGEPTWEVTRFFPRQGTWTETEYFALPTNHLVELSNGRLEVLPMPTYFHQLVVAYLYESLKAHVSAHAPGVVLFAPLPMHLWPGTY